MIVELKMKSVDCKSCGSKELIDDKGYVICAFCQSRFHPNIDTVAGIKTVIDVNLDIQNLLNKCIADPSNRRRYANLILDIDPFNKDALKFLT